MMCRNIANPWTWIPFLIALCFSSAAFGQFIDFETLPGGAITVDQQEISTEYSIHGVTFTLLSRDTGMPIGSPLIAKAGPPMTAFQGCYEDDTPLPHLDLGTSFLTDGTEVAVEGDLLIEYTTPVAQASGIILDIDCRNNGGPPCEQWTITAYDAVGTVVGSQVLDAISGPPNPACEYPEAGFGDSAAFGWSISTGAAQIKSIILKYTGTAPDVGLAFDNFSVAGEPPPLSATASSPADTICAGETIALTVTVFGGYPPYTFQWQTEFPPSGWIDLGTDATQEVQPTATSRYRVLVTDSTEAATTTGTVEIVILPDDPLCQASLLVSSYSNDRVIRYSFRSRLPSIFVSSGSGGLNGPSKLTCGNDGELYISSQDNDRIMRFDGATGAYRDIFVAGGSGGLNIPIGIDFGPDGNLYVASYSTDSVLRFDGSDGSPIDVFIPSGSGLNGPSGLVFGPDDDLFVCSFNGDKVLRFDGTTGAPLGDFVPVGSGGLDAPRGLVFGQDNRLYVSEQYHDSVRRYDATTGDFVDIFVPAGSGGLDRANDVVFGPDGLLYVAGFGNNQVMRYDGVSGTFLDALPNDFLNGPGWFAIGCQPTVSPVPDWGHATLGLSVETGAPNPFNPRTEVAFTLGVAGHTRVTVLDLKGRIMATLLDRHLPQGRHTVGWNGHAVDGRAAPSGVYFLCVESGGARESSKVMLVR